MDFSNFFNFCPLNNSLELWIIFSWISLLKGMFWQNKKKFDFLVSVKFSCFGRCTLVTDSPSALLCRHVWMFRLRKRSLLNHCLLLARYYIRYCKFKNVSPCIGEYVQRLKFNFEIEKQVSMVTGSENKFQQRWCKILQTL